MFFSDSRQHFFNPLIGKYRELVAECLSLLYQRLYTDLRDYGNALSREQLVDIFKEAIARSPILDVDRVRRLGSHAQHFAIPSGENLYLK